MRWDSTKELGTARGLSFLFAVYQLFGRLPFCVVLTPVIFWFLVFKPVPRRASYDYLQRVLGRPVKLRDCLRHFFNFADAALDKLIAWNGGFSLSDVEFHGLENIERILAGGKGCVLIVSHLGNAEIGRVLSRFRKGLELHILVYTQHAENFNRIIKQLDPTSQINLYQVAELDASLAALLSERVEHGAVVVLAGDRVPINDGQRVSTTSFLGGNAPFPQGPFILAAALKCPVLLFFCLKKMKKGEKKFDIFYEFFENAIVIPRSEREKGFEALIRRYAGRLEHYCKLAPYQWYNFYSFWRNNPA